MFPVVKRVQEAIPRRKDAIANHKKLLLAAREVFAAEGFDVALDVIARKAGVGRATLYRNFPDRFALGKAIFDENLRTLETLSEEHKDRPECFALLLNAIVEQQIACHALIPALLMGPSAPDLQELAKRMTKLFSPSLAHAQALGQVRTDLTATELLSVVGMISSVLSEPITSDQTTTLETRRIKAGRALDFVLNGIFTRSAADSAPRPQPSTPEH